MWHIELLCLVSLCCPSMFDCFVLNRERALQYDGNLGDYFDKEKELLNLQDQYKELKDQYEFEKFFHMLMRRGSTYLNGLKNALQYFVVETEHCDEERTLNENLTLQFIANATFAAEIANSTQNYAELDNENVVGNTTRRCQNITRSREDIISLVDLAAYTAEMAQEARKYDPDEEIMLIAKLAKLLSILADKAGYKPKAEDFVNLDFKDEVSEKKSPMEVSTNVLLQFTQTITDAAIAEMNRQNNFTKEHKKEYYFDPHARSKRQIVVTEDNQEGNSVLPLQNNDQTIQNNTIENNTVQITQNNSTTEYTTNRSDTSNKNNRTTEKAATSSSSGNNMRKQKARVIKNYDKEFFRYRKYDLGDHFKYKKGRNVSDFDAMAAALVARDQALIFTNPPNEMAYRYGGAFVPGFNQFAFALSRYIIEAERP